MVPNPTVLQGLNSRA